MFGFLVGMIIGDSAKSRSGSWHRHLGLVFSKKYESNERIGEFTCLCAKRLGLRMHRVAGQPKRKGKPHGFFEWGSQASPFVDWMFNVLLGLKDGERTTYDAAKMDWAFESPEEFRGGLVQGIAKFWIGPNWNFFGAILRAFGVRSSQNREALSVAKRQIANLARIPPFAPQLSTVRDLRFEKLAKATHIRHGRRLPKEIRELISTS